jgi:TPR repeat protein
MKKILLDLALLLSYATSTWADFNDGVVAHLMGQYEEALQTLLPLAETSDHPYAQYYLGVMYANGQGVEQDFDEAAKWYGKAAKQGVPQAQFRLGELYTKGQGVPQDFEYACAWFTVATHLGHAQASKALENTSQRLSPEELAEAKKLGTEFIQQYGKKPGMTKSFHSLP